MNTQNLGDLIRTLAENGAEIYSEPCEVLEVKGEFVDVRPLSKKADILGANLLAGTSKTPFKIIPSKGSIVMVTYTSKDTAFVTCYSEIDTIELRGNQFGGLIKIDDLVTKLNGVENKLNDLITKFNGHIHVTTATVLVGAPGVISPTTTPETPIAPVTTKSDLENPDVVHG